MTTKNVIIIFFIVSVVFTIFVILRKKKTTTTNNLQAGNTNSGFNWNFLDNVDYNENTWGGSESEYTEEEWNEINAEFENMGTGWGG